jgi:hypothetical protein
MKRLRESRVARLVLALVALASLTTGITLTQTAGTASARAVMGWPELYPAGYPRCVIGLEVGDYYGHPYAITRDLGYGVGSGWCEGTDPYLGNNHRWRVSLSYWVPGCVGSYLVCTVTYHSGWVSGWQYQGTDTYVHVGGSYVATPYSACITSNYWQYGFGWTVDTHPQCVYY